MLADSCKYMLFFLWVILFAFPATSHAISTKSYSYDEYGNVQKITDPRGFTTQYHYDLINRLERIDYPDNRSIQYSYDLSNIRTKMKDHRGTTVFERDEFGRIAKVTFPDGQTVSYYYDLENNLIKLVYPDNTEVEYTHDLSNRLETVKDSSGVTRFEYDELNNTLKKKILPNGVTTEYRYDTTRKISNVIHKSASSKLIEEFRYTYDENGNRTKIEKISSEGSSHVVYTYDKLNRVVKAEYSDGFFEEFSYDGAGNRCSKTTSQGTIVYEYDEENRLKRAGDTLYVYDRAGNLIKKSSPGHKATYKYDFDNRLIFYSDESNQVAFEYDGNGNRVSKTANGVHTEYINDLVAPVTQVLQTKIQGSWWKGEKKIRYTYGGSRISQSAEGKTQFYLCDSIGRNVSSLISSSGKVLNTYDYATFGNTRSEEQDITNAYKYCGEQFDTETGLIFLRNRYYDPEIGRFISKDPRPGQLDRPSTLNPYCYVENNPINFVDPWGFEAIEPETLELVIVHINGLPGWFGGQGLGGHVFMEFPARKESKAPFFGNYPGIHSFDEAANIKAKTVSVAGYCNSQKVTQAIEAMQEIKWNLSNNCAHTIIQGMKIMEFPEIEKVRLATVPIPLEFQSQMLKLHQRDPGHPLTYPKEELKSSSITPSPLGMNFAPRLDFGGVSLSTTAELQMSMADIRGAALDPVTGQIVLFGLGDQRYLPTLDLDDLTVAVRSVYGIGCPPKDPGVSIGTEPSPIPNYLKVRYDGATENTSFGLVMFEADRLLKCLIHGKDNMTAQPLHVNVPGYVSLLDRVKANPVAGGFSAENLFWFMPEKVALVESEDHRSMVFDDVRMKVLTNSQFRGYVIDPQKCNSQEHHAFAQHLTCYYDEFAKQFPILEDLKSLGKITGIVKWLKDNYIHFDLSFFANYTPKYIETPKYTPMISDSYEWVSGLEVSAEKSKKRKSKTETLYFTFQYNFVGGVLYNLSPYNYSVSTDSIAGTFADAAIQSRPSENHFSWVFDSPTNRESFVAIAQNLYHTKKPGNVKKSYIDLSIPVRGNQPLSIRRSYNSFSDWGSAFGRGWKVMPYSLELPKEKVTLVSNDGRDVLSHRMILVKTPEGEDFYRPFTLDQNDCPLLKHPYNSGLLRENLDGTFTLTLLQVGQVDFDNMGRLVRTSDPQGVSIEYRYQDGNLVSMHHQDGAEIILEYKGNHIVKATGPGNAVVHYTYDLNEQLQTVADASGIAFYYSYDDDKRLNKVADRIGNVLFEATYDHYNRAIAVKEGPMSYQAEFSLENRTMKITDSQRQEAIFCFDDKDRLVHKKETTGLSWEFVYGHDDLYSPTKIIGPKGDIAECRYDASGNLVYFKNPIGAEWRYFYDVSGNLVTTIKPNGSAVVHHYDQNREIAKNVLASLDMDEGSSLLNLENRAFSTSFDYDDEGRLVKSRNARSAEISFAYHKNGQLAQVISPTGYIIQFNIDERGRVQQIADGGGVQKCYEYDVIDRVKCIKTPTGDISFTYSNIGDLISIADARGCTTSYDYDFSHNLRQVTDNQGEKTTYEYNAFNQLTRIFLPNGSSKTIEYDSIGRLSREMWGTIDNPEVGSWQNKK